MTELLTTPERATERQRAKRIRALIYRVGGCAVCIHAAHGWGVSACEAPGRTFPRCLSTPGKQFEPDHERMKGAGHAPSK